MKNVESIVFKDGLDYFKKDALKNFKRFLVVATVMLIFIKAVSISTGNYGYAVKSTVSTHMLKSEFLTDSVEYIAKGTIPIKSNKLINYIISGTDGRRDSSFYMSNIDFLTTITILILLYFFTKDVLAYGPFHSKTINWLKKISLICFFVFIIKIALSFLVSYLFKIDYPQNDSIDGNYYLGSNGWLFVTVGFTFLINIFQYGRKLQEEQNLTI